MRDPQQFGREMAEMVRGYVARAVEPLRAENESLRAENKAMLDCLREVEARAIAAERHIEALAGQSEESATRLNATAKEMREKLDAMAEIGRAACRERSEVTGGERGLATLS